MAAIFGCSQENFSCTDIIVAQMFQEKQPERQNRHQKENKNKTAVRLVSDPAACYNDYL